MNARAKVSQIQGDQIEKLKKISNCAVPFYLRRATKEIGVSIKLRLECFVIVE